MSDALSTQGELRRFVVVVGSANVDLVAKVRCAPVPGETVMGMSLTEHAGGKGLNQAIAAAKVRPTALVGAIGGSRRGTVLIEALSAAGVDVTYVDMESEGEPGVAVVTVADGGENSVVVIPGANGAVTAAQATAALSVLRPAVVVTQLETPLDSVVASADWSRRNNARWTFNPSPFDVFASAPNDHRIRSLIAEADPLIVNAGEGRELLGLPSSTDTDEVARRLLSTSRSSVVTDGANGAYVCDAQTLVFIPARAVAAVDTTGAGDAFAGTVAAHLADGRTLAEAASAAVKAAAEIVATPRAER